MSRSSPCRLKVLASHPIQYFTPIYRLLAAHPQIDLEVLYCRDFGVKEQFDKQFDRRIVWDTDQLSGYRYRFLWNASPIGDPFNPLHAINPGAFGRVLADADAVWVNGYTYPSNWFALVAASLCGAAVLFRSDMRLDSHRPPRRFDSVRDGIIRWWVRRSDALLFIGQENRRAYQHYGADSSRMFFSPYSVDVDAMRRGRLRREESGEQLARWSIPEGRVVVLFVGKLTEQKHPEAMLELASNAQLRERIHILIAGSGPLGESLQLRVEREALDNVTLLGFINQVALPDVYAAADIFLMPSSHDQWGLVLNEAMASGAVPVVSDAVGAHADLITEGETGFVFASENWKQMQDTVCRLASDDRLRARMSAEARARAGAYSHEAAADGIVLALEHLALINTMQSGDCGRTQQDAVSS
jgi:glycosyltransferase involved in cell wall biosynthesis